MLKALVLRRFKAWGFRGLEFRLYDYAEFSESSKFHMSGGSFFTRKLTYPAILAKWMGAKVSA